MLYVTIVMGMFIYYIQLIISFIISTGCNDGIQRQCTDCEGTGIETLIYRVGPMIQQIQGKCSSCRGQGNKINNHNRCKNCHGNKLFNQKKRFDVNIVHGSQNGELIKFIGEGNQIVTFL